MACAVAHEHQHTRRNWNRQGFGIRCTTTHEALLCECAWDEIDVQVVVEQKKQIPYIAINIADKATKGHNARSHAQVDACNLIAM